MHPTQGHQSEAGTLATSSDPSLCNSTSAEANGTSPYPSTTDPVESTSRSRPLSTAQSESKDGSLEGFKWN